MPLHPLVRQADLLLHLLPAKGSSIEVFPSCGGGTAFNFDFIWCLDSNFLTVDNDEIVECSHTINSSGIFFINEVLISMFELELIRLGRFQIQKNDTISYKEYFSSQFLSGL